MHLQSVVTCMSLHNVVNAPINFVSYASSQVCRCVYYTILIFCTMLWAGLASVQRRQVCPSWRLPILWRNPVLCCTFVALLLQLCCTLDADLLQLCIHVAPFVHSCCSFAACTSAIVLKASHRAHTHEDHVCLYAISVSHAFTARFPTFITHNNHALVSPTVFVA